MPELPFGDWIVAAMTLGYIQLFARKSKWAWTLGMLAQLVWVYVSVEKQIYGLTALAVLMFFQFSYGWWKWKDNSK